MSKMAISFIAAFSLFITSVGIADAHPGRTDSNGGHTCRTNCSKWGYETGEYHYHNGGSSSSGSSSSGSNYTEHEYKPAVTTVDVYINDVWQSYDPGAYVKNGSTLVPMRAIFEALGATVEYDGKTKKVTAYKDNKIIGITIGSKQASIKLDGNTSTINLTNAAEIYKGTTMVPLRFISEALGANVEWNSVTQSVYITK